MNDDRRKISGTMTFHATDPSEVDRLRRMALEQAHEVSVRVEADVVLLIVSEEKINAAMSLPPEQAVAAALTWLASMPAAAVRRGQEIFERNVGERT